MVVTTSWLYGAVDGMKRSWKCSTSNTVHRYLKVDVNVDNEVNSPRMHQSPCHAITQVDPYRFARITLHHASSTVV